MIPSVGRIVHYRLSDQDAAMITRRRNDADRHLAEHRDNANGVIVHVGNTVRAGDVYPMMIVRVWNDQPSEADAVQGQVFLDGNDTLWKTSVQQRGHTYDPSVVDGVWFEPQRLPATQHTVTS